MRNLLLVSVGLIAVLGIVSGNLWRELRAERQVNAGLRAQPGQAIASNPGLDPVPVQMPQAVTEAKTLPVAPVQNPVPVPAAPVTQPTVVTVVAPANRVVTAAIQDAVRSEVMAQAEQTATGRVLQWRDRLTIAGQTLTTAQLQALNTAAITELRREATESLAAESTTEPLDAETVARKREETINRQNETNLRILRTASPQLTGELSEALRTMFEAGHAQRLAAARADRAKNANITNDR